ncbi:MAG: hypothetical protein NT075_35860 [Chloroflexi bacterium]|nr:hypothetical protein [Chloroflexota bacterium]
MTSKASPYQVRNIYLPIIIAPIRVSPLQFVTSNSCSADFSEPKLSSAIFAYGIKQLGVSTTVEGGINQPWRLEWSQNGQPVPALERQDVITQSPQLVTTVIVYGAQGQCGAALPQGAYQVRLFLNNAFYQEATVTIQ